MGIAEHAAIHRYVHEYYDTEAVSQASTFRAALRDARKLSGRHLYTGERTAKVAPTAFVGALTYLILLDQVGKAICPAPGRPPADVPFLAALTDFAPPLSERDREMLYSLRNALAHELAMVNEGRGNPLRRHRFELHEAEDRKLVVYPTTPWNGLFGDASGGGNTAVNLTELATLVEGVVALIEQMCQQRQLALVNGVTPEMVLDRWGFRIYHGPSC